MIEIAAIAILALVAYYAGYLHGTAEGRHRERWKIPVSVWKG